MKRKFINVTKEYIENLAPTDFCVELIQPAWETVNIYGTYEEYEESLKPYTTEQRYLLAMHWLGAEVANGGFQQFLGNSTAIVWEDAYKGYQAIGSEKLAYLIEELIKIYGRNIPFDREERVNILESFSEKKLEEIDTLTDLYYEIEETEWRKVTLWVKANSEKFLIQAEINDYSH
ncbi:DMP19 family protein [Fusobacterium animalis]|uniref:DMP19 family protein n=1 Tax=Fusobacterium animalis TaxID=76859 RepID=UPI0030D1C7CC